MMKQESIRDRLTGEFGEDVVKESVEYGGQIAVTVDKDHVVQVATFLKNDSELAFDFLSFVGGVDRLPREPRFEVVYQLYSTTRKHRFRFKALLEEPESGQASIDSVFSVWATADWHERETAEMYGITFNNHPDPRKLLLPDGWNVHPLRKDFPLEGTEDTPDLP